MLRWLKAPPPLSREVRNIERKVAIGLIVEAPVRHVQAPAGCSIPPCVPKNRVELLHRLRVRGGSKPLVIPRSSVEWLDSLG